LRTATFVIRMLQKMTKPAISGTVTSGVFLLHRIGRQVITKRLDLVRFLQAGTDIVSFAVDSESILCVALCCACRLNNIVGSSADHFALST
jgi:hypothetical protein